MMSYCEAASFLDELVVEAFEEDEAAFAGGELLVAPHVGEDFVVGDSVVEGEGEVELCEEVEDAARRSDSVAAKDQNEPSKRALISKKKLNLYPVSDQPEI